MAIIYGSCCLGNYTPSILVGLGSLVGILFIIVPRFWGRSLRPPIVTS